jgi:hypothetical protein
MREVLRQFCCLALRARPIKSLQSCGEALVEAGPPDRSQLLQQELTVERVGEAVTGRIGQVDLLQQARMDRLVQACDERALVTLTDRHEDVKRKVAPDDSGGTEESGAQRAEASESLADDIPQSVGKASCMRSAVCPWDVRLTQHSLCEQVPAYLLDEERIPFCLVIHELRQFVRHRLPAERLQYLPYLREGQTGEAYPLQRVVAAKLCQSTRERMVAAAFEVAIRADDQEWRIRQPAAQIDQEGQRILVGIVQVFDKQAGCLCGTA